MSTPSRKAPGASDFITTKCWQGRALFQVTEVADIVVQTIFNYRDSGAYLLHEFVVMPDHLHALLTPGPETGLEKAVQLIKGGSSFRIHQARGHKMELWQVGFYDWTVRDAQDWGAKVNYIHLNPVRAKLVVNPEDWLYSSASGKFRLDGIPERYCGSAVASGAKARHCTTDLAQGLKPLPPEEQKVLIAQRKGRP